MQKYFISKEELKNNTITSDDVFHITKVMRSRLGDEVIVSDEINEYLIKFTEFTKSSVTFERIKEITNNTELDFNITLFQGYPKGDKLDFVIKHSVELGIHSIYPTFTKRSNVKLDKDKYGHKLKRFNKIAKESAEQANRKYLPKVVDIVKLDKVDFSKFDHVIVCYEEDAKNNSESKFKQILKSFNKNDRIAIVVGPEGGLDIDEVNYLKNNNAISVGLGKRILKTQTCIMYVLGAISYEWEL